MNIRPLLLSGLVVSAILSGCGGQTHQPQSVKPCSDGRKVVEAFYAANDASQFAASVEYLTDDVVLVTWAEGANGHHMRMESAVGKDQVKDFLGKPGMKRTADQPNMPNYAMQEIRLSEMKMSFKLIPDRHHPDNRPYNPFEVEVFFSGCHIEILKVVERVMWL